MLENFINKAQLNQYFENQTKDQLESSIESLNY